MFLIISYAYSEVLFTAPASASSTSSKEQIDNGLDEEFAKFCAAAKVSGRLGHIKKSDAKLRSVLTELSLAIEDNKHLKSAAEAMSKARGRSIVQLSCSFLAAQPSGTAREART